MTKQGLFPNLRRSLPLHDGWTDVPEGILGWSECTELGRLEFISYKTLQSTETRGV